MPARQQQHTTATRLDTPVCAAAALKCSKFVAQLARLVAPGGTVVLVDFCRADGPISAATAQRLASMDRVFATPGNWHSANEYKKLMGERHSARD